MWTPKWGRHFIARRLGLEYGRERVRPLLHARGGRRRRLRHRHLQAKPEEQAALVAALTVLLEEWPEDCERICVEEATIRCQPTLTAPWCVGDEVPEVPTGEAQTQGQVYGAAAPLTGRPHDPVRPMWGQDELAPFLQPLLASYPRPHLLVIPDRGEPPQGAPVEAIIRDAGGQLMLKPPPASSPELNPPERIWKWWRRVLTHKHWCATRHEQIEALRHFFRDLAGVKDQGRRLCG